MKGPLFGQMSEPNISVAVAAGFAKDQKDPMFRRFVKTLRETNRSLPRLSVFETARELVEFERRGLKRGLIEEINAGNDQS